MQKHLKPGKDPDAAAIVASVAQGRQLRLDADALGLNMNSGFDDLIQFDQAAVRKLNMGGGLRFTVLGPRKAEIAGLQKKWDTDVKKLLAKGRKTKGAKGRGGGSALIAADVQRLAAAFVDESIHNLSSLVILAEYGGKRILLTGDARGDFVLQSLQEAQLLKSGKIAIDVFKLPHHGSNRNAALKLFKAIDADHYVISADGKYNNPDNDTIGMIFKARPTGDYHIWLTNDIKSAVTYIKKKKPAGVRLHIAGPRICRCALNSTARSRGSTPTGRSVIARMPYPGRRRVRTVVVPPWPRPGLHAEILAIPRNQAALCLHQRGTSNVADTEVSNALSAVRGQGEAQGRRIGPYLLLRVLGEGGMGTVYVAEQEHPVRRRVAVKVIRPGMGDSGQIVARFEAERQAQAMMDHVNIAKVLDAGTTDTGLPYFVMELVTGVEITQYCVQNGLPLRQRVELFLPVCRAIQHAHQKGIIHRDIKPSNVLVTVADGQPLPKVIDFGLVKTTGPRLVEQSMMTEYGMVVGTLEYMSPEQAEIDAGGVDTRSDIYSLGVLLYTLITGTTPLGPKLRKASITEAIRLVKEDLPPRPSTRLSTVADAPAGAGANPPIDPFRMTTGVVGDLDWIVMKCLEKDRTRRYESAGSLARDIERFLADEPVEACPPSASYRMRRFTRKHRKPLAVAAALLAMLVAGVVVSAWQALRATRAEQRAVDAAVLMEAERDRARLALTRQVAERLDGDLRRLETAGHVLAATVAQRTDWKERDLERWMRAVLEQDEQIFGMAVAFEPRQPVGRDDFSLYAFRGTQGVETKQLLPPSYVPIYREWDWYKKPFKEQRVVWSEPYVDDGGGNIPMVTVSTPIRREAVLVGILTFDLSVKYFDVLRNWLTELQLGDNSYGFVLSQSSVFVSHPFHEFDFARASPGKAPVRMTEVGDASFREIANLIQQNRSGSSTAVDPMTGNWATFLFAPIPSAEWTFVAVVE